RRHRGSPAPTPPTPPPPRPYSGESPPLPLLPRWDRSPVSPIQRPGSVTDGSTGLGGRLVGVGASRGRSPPPIRWTTVSSRPTAPPATGPLAPHPGRHAGGFT